jgi:hypothetical protein
MQRDCFPHEIGLGLRDAVTFQKRARRIRAVDLKSFCLGVIGVDEAEIVKQRRNVEQLRVKFQVLAKAFHRAEHEDSNRVIEQQLGLVLPYELGRFPGDSAVGNFDVGKNVSHCSNSCHRDPAGQRCARPLVALDATKWSLRWSQNRTRFRQFHCTTGEL